MIRTKRTLSPSPTTVQVHTCESQCVAMGSNTVIMHRPVAKSISDLRDVPSNGGRFSGSQCPSSFLVPSSPARGLLGLHQAVEGCMEAGQYSSSATSLSDFAKQVGRGGGMVRDDGMDEERRGSRGQEIPGKSTDHHGAITTPSKTAFARVHSLSFSFINPIQYVHPVTQTLPRSNPHVRVEVNRCCVVLLFHCHSWCVLL